MSGVKKVSKQSVQQTISVNMKLRVILVVIILTMSCCASASKTKSQIKNAEKKITELSNIKLTIKHPGVLHNTNNSTMVRKSTIKIPRNQTYLYNKLANPETSLTIVNRPELREHKKKDKHKKKMNRIMMALLLAYKLKFATLIPTFIGGLLLLLGTTALAGFFFALFAAILGLKGH